MSAIALELHQLDLRYQELRIRQLAKEGRILASLSEVGQQCPVIVIDDVRQADHFVLLDGFKRCRGLARLGQDVVQATQWALCEADALVLERVLRAGDGASALEDGWLLVELRDRFGYSEEKLSRCLGHSKGWASRRLGLVADLPEEIQMLVRQGALGAHAVMRDLLPLARANAQDGIALARAAAPLGVTSRQLAVLCTTYRSGSTRTRELVLADPALVLRAHAEAQRRGDQDKSAAERLLGDFELLGSIARRAHARLQKDGQALLKTERDDLGRCALSTWHDLAALWRRVEREVLDERPVDMDSSS